MSGKYGSFHFADRKLRFSSSTGIRNYLEAILGQESFAIDFNAPSYNVSSSVLPLPIFPKLRVNY